MRLYFGCKIIVSACHSQNNKIYRHYYFHVELMDLPPELLHAIILEAAVATVLREVIDDDAVFEAALTSLSDVCGRWNDIVNDIEGFFRRQFWMQLFRVGPWRVHAIIVNCHSSISNNMIFHPSIIPWAHARWCRMLV